MYPHIFADGGTLTGFRSGTDGTELDSFRWDPVNKKGYRFAQVGAAESFVANDVAYRKVASGNSGIAVDDLTLGARNSVLGLAGGTSTASYYGWFQTRGQATINKLISTAWAVGDLVIASATAKKATIVTAGTAPTYRPLGWVTATASALATTGVGVLFLD